MNKTFLLKIKFTDTFFFGQGTDERGALGNSANYFLHSNSFPQQTGLRGFLRYLLLQINNCCFPSGKGIDYAVEKKITDLVGKNSNDVNSDIGIIKRFSPLFVFLNDKPLFYRPYEFVEQCPQLYIPVIFKQNKGRTFSFIQRTPPKTPDNRAYYLDGFNAKKGFAEGFTDSIGQFIPFENIYKKHLISGNRKKADGTPDDESYYKQDFFSMSEPYSFGLWIEFDTENKEDLILPESGSTYFSVMGKEKKEVVISFLEQSPPDFSTYFSDYSADGAKILLLSDAYVDSGFEDQCFFGSNQVISFRYIHSSTKTENYSRLNDTRRSAKGQYLIQRGSVLYLKNNNTSFLDNPIYQNIGYNYYTKLKIN